MASWDELVGALQSEDKPETIYDDLNTYHQNLVEGSTAALAKRDADIAAQQAEIQSLKAMNFETMMRAGTVTDDDDDAEPETPAEPQGINSLFTFQPRK